MMIKFIKFLIAGIVFGIIMTKSEAISWFRIQEMFRFESFHMYGIIGVAIGLGALFTFLLKKTNAKTMHGTELNLTPKAMSVTRYLVGGSIFGFGWAMTGACPGPLFTLLGHGIWSIAIVIASATFGTFVYGVLRSKLPH